MGSGLDNGRDFHHAAEKRVKKTARTEVRAA